MESSRSAAQFPPPETSLFRIVQIIDQLICADSVLGTPSPSFELSLLSEFAASEIAAGRFWNDPARTNADWVTANQSGNVIRAVCSLYICRLGQHVHSLASVPAALHISYTQPGDLQCNRIRLCGDTGILSELQMDVQKDGYP
jgi:hypothetical protein